jgi:hypothetical protein
MRQKYRVYIAGPISKGPLAHNVRQADEAFLALTKAGLACLNPMWSVYAGATEAFTDDYCTAVGSRNSSLPLQAEDWYGLDLPWVEVSHAVLRLPGESRGADGEVEHARKHGIPVFHTVKDLVQYLEAKDAALEV